MSEIIITEPGRKISTLSAIKEGWFLVRGLKLPVFFLATIQFLTIMAKMIVIFVMLSPIVKKATQLMADKQTTELYLDYFSLPPSTLLSALAVYMGLGFIGYFLTAMLMMLGIRQSIGLPIEITQVFRECKKVYLKIIMLFLVVAALVLIPYSMQMLKSIGLVGKITLYILQFGSWYISMALAIFSLPLLVIKPVNVITAIKIGIQKMNANWLAILLIFVTLFPLMVLGVFTLFIAYIWLTPLIWATFGVCFRDAFGISKQ